MSERPILFSGAMVKAILEGRKTMTRRVVKFPGVKETWRQAVEHQAMQACYPMPKGGFVFWSYPVGKDESDRAYGESAQGIMCPYGVPGDQLWVRETWRPCQVPQCSDSLCVEYAASERCKNGHLTTLNRKHWKSPIYMPHQASRLTLEITDIRVERLLVISEDDARSEGVVAWHDTVNGTVYTPEFQILWDEINGKTYPWASNPWVWVIGFEKVGP